MNKNYSFEQCFCPDERNSLDRSMLRLNQASGFTLIELMIRVAIVAIIAAIAIPSYDTYIRRADLSTAQQEMQKISALLEQHRARNFSYDGFVLKGTSTTRGLILMFRMRPIRLIAAIEQINERSEIYIDPHYKLTKLVTKSCTRKPPKLFCIINKYRL